MTSPGRWLEVAVRAADRPGDETRAAELAEALLALGGRAVVEDDEGWMVTHLEAAPGRDEGWAREQIEAAVGPDGFQLRVRVQDQEDWSEAWKRGLDVRRISPRLVVRPSWIPFEASAGDVVIVLDPGMAFGTAEHGTTRGCLRLLDGVVAPGERVLDVGAGSGILSIAAALLGAAEVDAVEGDPLACQALRENLAANGVTPHVRVHERWADEDFLASLGPADGVVANIESGPLTALLKGFAAAVRPGGWLILSGILDEEFEAIQARAAECGFTPTRTDLDGVWRSGLFRRAAPPA